MRLVFAPVESLVIRPTSAATGVFTGATAPAPRHAHAMNSVPVPVETVEIVGRDLRIVERVAGRLTSGRATLAGAAEPPVSRA